MFKRKCNIFLYSVAYTFRGWPEVVETYSVSYPTLGQGLHIQLEILERFQSKALRMIIVVDAPWYVPNTLIRRDLQISSIKEEISHYNSHYSARLTAHPNDILLTLLEQPERKRLRRCLPNDLPTKFMV
jgi:hypothetical protein